MLVVDVCQKFVVYFLHTPHDSVEPDVRAVSRNNGNVVSHADICLCVKPPVRSAVDEVAISGQVVFGFNFDERVALRTYNICPRRRASASELHWRTARRTHSSPLSAQVKHDRFIDESLWVFHVITRHSVCACSLKMAVVNVFDVLRAHQISAVWVVNDGKYFFHANDLFCVSVRPPTYNLCRIESGYVDRRCVNFSLDVLEVFKQDVGRLVSIEPVFTYGIYIDDEGGVCVGVVV